MKKADDMKKGGGGDMKKGDDMKKGGGGGGGDMKKSADMKKGDDMKKGGGGGDMKKVWQATVTFPCKPQNHHPLRASRASLAPEITCLCPWIFGCAMCMCGQNILLHGADMRTVCKKAVQAACRVSRNSQAETMVIVCRAAAAATQRRAVT